MDLLMENYLALYLAIVRNYTPDKALRAMGIGKDYKLNEMKGEEEETEVGEKNRVS
ncbi:MAG: hypothetical protein JJT76_06355 [Clostridiaceae bacterium]|nr:hypothetical protein [Clostridiaceae bacterium]